MPSIAPSSPASSVSIRSTTNVIVTPRTTQSNYVEITCNTGTSCASSLGMVGGLFAGSRSDKGFMEAGWRGLEKARD